MRRRGFITLFGGAATAWPLAARAQQAMPLIGFLGSATQAQWAGNLAAVHKGLSESGYVEGQNFAAEYRWAEGQTHRLPALAADLAARPVNLIIALGGTVSALAAKAATASIPIIFIFGGDPVRSGMVASLNRPGGNVTGVSFLLNALIGKRLELLREVAPAITSISLLANSKNPNYQADITDIQEAARALGLQVNVLTASNESEIDAAFNGLSAQPTRGLFVLPDPVFFGRQAQIVAQAARHSIPATHFAREFVAAGGLMSYATSILDAHRNGGIQAARVLKGAQPADLPVVQPTKFELVINLKTAKILGLTLPQTLLVAADEVIE
jgi:putative ABC transport system substrate-binding protein